MFIIKEIFCSSEYKVDDCGNVYGKKGNILKPSINPHGYKIVNLIIDGEQIGKAVHTLVARAFCNGYEEGLQVNHKDGNKLNNNANNLEWVTAKENVRHSIEVLGQHIGANNGNAKKVYAYDKKTLEFKYEFESVMDDAKFFVGNDNYKKAKYIQNLICSIANRKYGKKSYKGMIWTYTPIEREKVA